MNEQDTIVFGIDLGMTNSCIACVDDYGQAHILTNEEGQRSTPSVVYFDGDTRIVGREAKNNAVAFPDQVVELVKRHMGEDGWRFPFDGIDYTAEEISSYILRKLASDTENQLGVKVTDVVITCPAYFGVNQREATAKAGEIVGFKVWEVLNEPTAAAIMYGVQKDQDQVVLVYDLGGGTFDITAIEIKGNAIRVIATGGDHTLGGRNWDESVVMYLAEKWMEDTGSSEHPMDSRETQQDLLQKAEAAKWTLSARQEATVMVVHEGQRVPVKLTREKFNELTALWLERTIRFTREIMDEADKRGYTKIDQILLVGGSTRMPQVRARLEQEFSLPMQILDPDEAVAKGVAIYAKKLLIDHQIKYELAQDIKASTNEIDIARVLPDKIKQTRHQASQVIGFHPFRLKARSSFFVLLGLNPDERWDQVRFETLLKSKQRQWGMESTGIGPKANQAKIYISLLAEIQRVMSDLVERENEANEARKELVDQKKERIGKFENQLRRAQSKGYLEEAEFKGLVKDFADVLTEPDIRSRVTVPVQAATSGSRKPDQLDASVAKEIAQKLSHLHLKSLYELLGKPPTHSRADLYTLADQLYLDMVKRPPSPEITLTMELAGQGMKVFDSDVMRAKYDATLHQEKINVLLKDLGEIVSRTASKEVHENQIQDFLNDAGFVGWGQVEALIELRAYGYARKWLLNEPTLNTPSDTISTQFFSPVQGVVIGDSNTVTLIFQGNKERTIPFLAPSAPPYDIVGRNDLLHSLKQRLFSGGNLALSALNGLPGVGKTALAIALTHDHEVIRHFSDGILWAGLGREADKLSLLDIWGMALGIPKSEMERLTSFNARKIAIHNAIGLRRMLLVIDDAWSVEDAVAFKLGGPLCAHVVTTRFPQIAEVFAGEGATVVKELDEDDGLVLLKRLVPNLMETVPGEALDLVHLVGGLPLPLILIGNYLRIQMNTGQTRRLRTALNQLRLMEERLKLKQYQGGLERHTSLPEGVPLSQLAVIKISDEALDKDASYTLRALSVFPSKPNSFSEEAALSVAGTSTTTIDTLADFGLLESSGSGRYTLHQTISDYAQYELSDITVYTRMVEYFIEYVETHKIDYSLLERETSNILAAVEIFFEREIEIGRGAKALSHFIHMLRRTRVS